MDRQYVGIDFHRRRSVVVRMSASGEKLSCVRIPNDPVAIAAAVAEAGPDPEVVVEATYGWYWVVDLLQANGAQVHLANPHGLNWGQRRVKNDERDAIDLADMLRWVGFPRRGSPRRRLGSCGSWCATGPSSWRCGRGTRLRCMR
jgi:transposase